MVGRKGSGSTARSTALLALLLLGASRLAAEQLGEFSFEILPDGTPRFTQVLRWSADPNALFYEVTVQKATGEEVAVSKLEEPLIKLNLSPGDYRFRVVLYNLLGKPDLELPWKSFTVRKAEIPRVTGVSPNTLFLEDEKGEFRISGENLVPGATIVLKPSAAPAASIAGTELRREGNATVNAEFPVTTSSAPGEYSLELTNPGGLSFTVPAAVTVRFARPVDFLITGGYAPWIALYDNVYLLGWPGVVFPLGAATRISVYFIKQPFGYFGAQLEAAGRFMAGGSAGAVINSEVGWAGIRGLYKYRFTPLFSAIAAFGAGVELSHHKFDYGITAGPEISSADLYLSGGLSAQFYFTKYFYLESGADLRHVFALGFSEGGLMPFVSAGIQF